MIRRLPVFPLGTVLLPYTLLPLHIFEPRYQAMLKDLLSNLVDGASEPEMGVVLIEKGQEVGGGEQRTDLGTIARIVHSEALEGGRFFVVCAGVRRFAVEQWLPDDPYPLADVEEQRDVPWDDAWQPSLAAAERGVRRALALAAEMGEQTVTLNLAPDPTVASWQLCGAVPVGPFDRQRLLSAADTRSRLELLESLAAEAAELLAFRLSNS